MVRIVLASLSLLLILNKAVYADSPAPVTFKGENLTITRDGSPTAFNPHTEAGKQALAEHGDACCIVVPLHGSVPSAAYVFSSDLRLNRPHETKRMALNLKTGSFVSTTSLQNTNFPTTDPKRYVNSDITPLIALSDEQVALCGCELGDRALLSDSSNTRRIWAVFALNAGAQPDGLTHAEISAPAATGLGLELNWLTKKPASKDYKITITIYPGSGKGQKFPNGPIPPVTVVKK